MNGKEYLIEHLSDTDAGLPWEREDGHGEVSEWTKRGKRPGELTLMAHRYYDFAGACKIARRDGWGRRIIHAHEGGARGAGGLSPRMKAARAVRADYERLRAWCESKWEYIGVVVTPLTPDGDELRSKSRALWGIESDAGDYLDTVARELIGEINS